MKIIPGEDSEIHYLGGDQIERSLFHSSSVTSQDHWYKRNRKVLQSLIEYTNLTRTQSIFYIETKLNLLKHTSFLKPLWLPTADKFQSPAWPTRLGTVWPWLISLSPSPARHHPCWPPVILQCAKSVSGPLQLQFPLLGQLFPCSLSHFIYVSATAYHIREDSYDLI